MRIGGDEAVAVAHQHQVAVALELVARIGDDAVLGRLDRRAFGHREVDAVVLQAVRLGSEAGDDAAAHRPAEARQPAGRLRRLDRRSPARAPRASRRGRCAAIPRSRAFGAGRRRRRLGALARAAAGAPIGCTPGMMMRSPTFTMRSGANVVGRGEHHHRLAVEPRDAVQRLARRDDMHARGRRQRGPRRADRHARCRSEAIRVVGGAYSRPPLASARDHQMLARTHHGSGW